MNNLLEEIKTPGEQLLALIIRAAFDKSGISFLTPDENILQVGYMSYSESKKIQPHIHNQYKREITGTQEVVYIKEGKVRVNFFDLNKEYVSSRELNQGDCIVLVGGGHGFDILEPTKMIEIKNGPYAGDQDKVRF